jgi:MtN3 and saliva related transmembrane protein
MPFLSPVTILSRTAGDEVEAVRVRDRRRPVHGRDHGGIAMSPETTQVLGAAATVYGLGGAFSVLLQARRMHVRGTSGDVSARFFAVYVGGFAVWLLYGLGIGDVPIILVHAVGLLCGSITLTVALMLRRPAAVAARIPSADEDRARTRPGQPPARERDYRARPVGVRLRGRRDDRAPAAREAEEVCV